MQNNVILENRTQPSGVPINTWHQLRSPSRESLWLVWSNEVAAAAAAATPVESSSTQSILSVAWTPLWVPDVAKDTSYTGLRH